MIINNYSRSKDMKSHLKHQSGFAMLSIGLLMMLAFSASEARSVNLPSPQCHPSIVNSMPPKIKKICDALTTIWEFSDAMQSYLDEKGKTLGFVLFSRARVFCFQFRFRFFFSLYFQFLKSFLINI